jgi:hypothetical protein
MEAFNVFNRLGIPHPPGNGIRFFCKNLYQGCCHTTASNDGDARYSTFNHIYSDFFEAQQLRAGASDFAVEVLDEGVEHPDAVAPSAVSDAFFEQQLEACSVDAFFFPFGGSVAITPKESMTADRRAIVLIVSCLVIN